MKKKKKSVKKKGSSLKNHYSESWNYIKEIRNFIYFVIGVFFVFGLIGYFVPAPDFVVEQIKTIMKELIEQTKGMNSWELIVFIFLNNVEASFLGMVLGVFLGIFSVIFAIGNGYFLGFVSSMVVEEAGIGILLRLLPHGIFELPAIFISLGLGIKFGTFIFQKEKAESFREYLWNSLRVFLFIIIPLLIIAAVIEGVLIGLGS